MMSLYAYRCRMWAKRVRAIDAGERVGRRARYPFTHSGLACPRDVLLGEVQLAPLAAVIAYSNLAAHRRRDVEGEDGQAVACTFVRHVDRGC